MMGEARAKLEADACGIPRPRDNWCPSCRSKRIHDMPKDFFPAEFGVDCDWQGCLDCRAVWEPFPASYARDPVCAEPCDNCAFRPGSPEQRDSAKWKALIETLKPDQSYGYFTGRFFCHKNVPIDLTKGPGNFLFPQKPLLMDGEPVRKEDGSIATTEDPAKMRTCTGFFAHVLAASGERGTG
jgi:hypothetical protein